MTVPRPIKHISFFFLCVQLIEARILFVPDDFVEPQFALDASIPNDTIIMRSGIFSAPLIIPAHILTLGSEFILINDHAFISNCVIRPTLANPHVRCIDTEAFPGNIVELNVIGITIQEAYSIGADGRGGGIRLRNRAVQINDCVIESCASTDGGGIFADSSILVMAHTEISGCDAQTQGRCLYLRSSVTTATECVFRSSATILPSNGDNGEIALVGSPLSLARCEIRGMGNSSEGRATLIILPANSVCSWVTVYNCTIENNSLSRFILSGNQGGMHSFALDSCQIFNNAIAFGLFVDGEHDSLQRVTITRNRIENNRRPAPNISGVGLLSLGRSQVSAIVEENYFLSNDGGAFSCIQIYGQRDPNTYRVQRNYFSGNSNYSVSAPPGGAVIKSDLAQWILEYNAFVDNIGPAVFAYSNENSPTSYALHNYWGDSTGPYELTRNPGGLGDSTNEITIYDEWLQSEDEIPDTSQFPDAIEEKPLPIVSSWRLGKIYPNPFNSEFRVELDGMTGADFEIRMFDLLGREVSLLHSGRTLRGTLSFSAPPNLAAGIYFLRGRDHLFTETKKILYLK